MGGEDGVELIGQINLKRAEGVKLGQYNVFWEEEKNERLELELEAGG